MNTTEAKSIESAKNQSHAQISTVHGIEGRVNEMTYGTHDWQIASDWGSKLRMMKCTLVVIAALMVMKTIPI